MSQQIPQVDPITFASRPKMSKLSGRVTTTLQTLTSELPISCGGFSFDEPVDLNSLEGISVPPHLLSRIGPYFAYYMF